MKITQKKADFKHMESNIGNSNNFYKNKSIMIYHL